MNKVNFKFKKPNLDWSKLNLRKFNTDTLMALLSYFNILVLIPLIFSRKNEFVHFHAKQGTILLLVWVLFYFSFYFPVAPFVVGLIILIMILIGVINVSIGKKRSLPIIGRLA